LTRADSTQSASFLFVMNGMEVAYAIEERQLTISRAGDDAVLHVCAMT